MAFNLIPYTNFHDLNLDWILDRVKEMISAKDEVVANMEAAQAAQTGAEAAQTGAEAAQTGAEAAQLAAEAAQGYAEAAATNAGNSATAAQDTVDTALSTIGDATSGAVADWLEENVTPSTTVVLDKSLSIEGAAADAKAAGVAVSGLRNFWKENINDLTWTQSAIDASGNVSTSSNAILTGLIPTYGGIAVTVNDFNEDIPGFNPYYIYVAVYSDENTFVSLSAAQSNGFAILVDEGYYIRLMAKYQDNSAIAPANAPFSQIVTLSPTDTDIRAVPYAGEEGKAADARATSQALLELSTDKASASDLNDLRSAIDYLTKNNMITASNFCDAAYQTYIVPNVSNLSLSVNNYVSSNNAEVFYFTRRESANYLTFNTATKYFVAARLAFDDTQTAGLIASGVHLELTDNSTRNTVAHGRLYPAMLTGKTVVACGLLTPTITQGFLRLVFEGMGTSSINYAFTLDKVFCAEMPDGMSVEAMRGVWSLASNPINALDFSGAIASLQYPDYDAKLICWGDSLTAGNGGAGATYPAVCASELGGISLLNCGVGGENCETIAARQGGNNIVIPSGAVNGTYETLTDIFGNSVTPLLQAGGATSGDSIIINGETCALTYASGTGYTISGYTGDALTVPTIARFAGSDFKGDIVTFWIGTNGGNFPGLSAGVDIRIAWINSMIKHLGHDRYVVLGLTVGEETASFYTNEENRMKQAFGNKYLPTRKYLIESGLTIAGITPTTQDETDIAEGKVPTSLKSDSVHLNASGYTAVGKLLANKIRSLGYV